MEKNILFMKENQRKEILRLTNLSGCYCLCIIVYTWQIFPIININHLQLQNLCSEKIMFSLSIPQTAVDFTEFWKA